MMKLKSTLFGVLTAVSLGLVAPFANASQYTCDDIIRVSGLVASQSLHSDSLKRYGRGVVQEVKNVIPEVASLYARDVDPIVMEIGQWWMSNWRNGNQDMLALSVMNRIHLGQDRVKSAIGQINAEQYGFEMCVSYGMGSYHSVTKAFQ